MIPYEILAGWYDELMHDVPYAQWAKRILSIFEAEGLVKGRILELAAGTGSITERLLEAGFWVTAVDRSEAMLQEANQRLGGFGGRLRLVASDMLEYNTEERYDAVISVCDGFNYLSDLNDLKAVLKKCCTLCRPGGLILFDLSTAWKFENLLKDTVIAENHEDMAYIWENNYYEDQRLLEFSLTFFVKEKDVFHRYTEHHRQRAHSIDEIRDLCSQMNLQVLGFFDEYGEEPVSAESQRFHCILKTPTGFGG